MIRTRDGLAHGALGKGAEIFALTSEQVEVMAALLSVCLMGQSPHSNAVYELFQMIEEKYGNDFIDDAIENSGMEISLVDHGNVYHSEVIDHERLVIEFTT